MYARIYGTDQRSTMACADPDMNIHGEREEYEEPSAVEQQYMATEFLPEEKGPLHDLLQKQPAVLGFFIAGIVSSLLLKYPSLLSVSYGINCSCIAVSVVAACLISVDLARLDPASGGYYQMEILVLCVLGLEVSLSTVLCFWFSKEKRAKST
ncbi:hypothetical protein INR49_024142 [Caranx melampygus]|nr:hypothetical protein INR49_024142 [Caranx melampygus]